MFHELDTSSHFPTSFCLFNMNGFNVSLGMLCRHAYILHTTKVRHAKEFIHSFEGQLYRGVSTSSIYSAREVCAWRTYPFRFRYEEEGSHTNGEAERSVDEVSPVTTGTHGIQHDGGRPCDHQIEYPLRCSRIGNSQSSEPLGGDLGGQHPTNRS